MKKLISKESRCQLVAFVFWIISVVINLADENYNGTFAAMLVSPPHDGGLKGKSGERPALSP